MTENFSHEVKAEYVRLCYFNRAPAAQQVQLHKAGCAHEAKADSLGGVLVGAKVVHETLTKYVDDYYYVAPCARKA